MNECPVCYSDIARCKLVCGHSFCKSCVKSWYHQCTDAEGAKCPMCRHRLYFKGMYKVLDDWEDERIELKEQEAFQEVFDSVFESEEDTWDDDDDEEEYDDDDDSTWSDWWTPQDENEQRMEQLRDLQKRFQLLQSVGVPVHPELLDDTWYDVFSEREHMVYDNSFWHVMNLFVSRYKGVIGDEDGSPPHYETRPHDAFETVSVILAF